MARAAAPLLAGLLLALPAHAADALTDLQGALARLKGATPLRGQISVRSDNKRDDDVTQGQAQLPFEDGPQGLRLSYPADLLSKLDQEDVLKAQNPKAATPTATGVDGLGLRDLRTMARAAEHLQRRLQLATFKGEVAEAWQGQPARRLTFELENTSKDKYIKSYTGTLQVWVAADGTPLASRTSQKVAGRAMLVISFEFNDEDETVYAVHGERLVALRKTSRGSGSGGGEKGSTQRQLALVINPPA